MSVGRRPNSCEGQSGGGSCWLRVVSFPTKLYEKGSFHGVRVIVLHHGVHEKGFRVYRDDVKGSGDLSASTG